MRGHEAVVAARLAGVRIDRIEVERLLADDYPGPVLGDSTAGIERRPDGVVGSIEILARESVATLDLRCCHGMDVLVLAGSYEAGWPVAERIIEVEPASLRFAAPAFAARYENGRLEAWEL